MSVVLLTFPLFAQYSSSIEGIVTDRSGAVVPGAAVHVTNLATGVVRQAITTDEGFYRVVNLGPGAYSVVIEHAGFRQSEQRGITVATSEIVRVNATLDVGTVGEKVTVEAEVPQVETEQGRISGHIATVQLKELPLNGRNPYSLLALQPGVSGRGLAATFGAGGGGANNDSFAAENQPEINASGQRVESNSYTLDDSSVNSAARGGVANVTPNADSIAEVRVVANNFSAVNGRSSGGQVEMVTKSGTNEFHGGASEYFQNNTLAGRNEFDAKVPVFRRNEFGAYFGGPVLKNRTFFFTSFEGLRQSGARSQVYTVETAQFRDFVTQTRPNTIASQLLTQFKPAVDATSNFRDLGSPPPLGTPGVATGTIGPVDGIADIGSVPFAPAAYRNGQQVNLRIDHQLRAGKDTLYGNFYRTWADTLNGGIRPQFNRPGHEYGAFISLNETHIFSPTKINELRGNMTRVVGLSDFPPNAQVPQITIPSISGFSTNGYPSGYFQTNFNYKDVFSWIHAAHTIKMGGELRRVRANSINTSNFIPSYSFASLLVFANDAALQQTRLVDPRTGVPAVNEVGLRDWEWALFVNDDWKITRNLTLNVGLRYESYETPSEVNGLLRNLIFGSGSNFNERLSTAKMDVVPSMFPRQRGNWAPRLGFAWDPNGKGKTSIRGGYGIAYDRLFMTPLLDFRNDPPLRATATLGPRFGTSFTYALGDPSKPYLGFPIDPALQLGLDQNNGIKGAAVSVLAFDPNMKTAYTHNWFFGIQHSLGAGIVAEVDYTGSAGHHLYENSNVDRYAGDLLFNGRFHGFNPSFSVVNFISSGSNSIYNGATARLRRRFHRGVMIEGSYTFSRAIDDADTLTNIMAYQDISNRRLDRALAGFDVTHRLSMNGIWELPFLRGKKGIARALLGGWQLAGFAILQSGFPLNIVNTAPYPSGDYNADGTSGDRPNAPAESVPRSGFSREQFLTGMFPASAFPIPAPGANGTLGRNTFRGPGFVEVDTSLDKRFAITERVHLQFRVDAFNVLNHVNLNSPVVDLSSTSFGRSTSALSPRQFQLALRLEF
jgi:outer membrane receptor protein involved in Fe transport